MAMSIGQFIDSQRLRMTVDYAESNPHMTDASPGMDHWRCMVRSGRKSMTVYFSMGSGHHGEEPELRDVLDCLASDAAGWENAGGFDEWCGEYGYDTDSRSAEKTYRIVERQAKRLRAFLGDAAYNLLLWETERA